MSSNRLSRRKALAFGQVVLHVGLLGCVGTDRGTLDLVIENVDDSAHRATVYIDDVETVFEEKVAPQSSKTIDNVESSSDSTKRIEVLVIVDESDTYTRNLEILPEFSGIIEVEIDGSEADISLRSASG